MLVELHHHIGDTMVAAFREEGGQPSIGIDVELYTSGQMFREMQAALLFARGKEVRNNALAAIRRSRRFRCARARRSNGPPSTAPSIQARRQDRHARPGKKADIVMLRADDVNMVPVHDPIFSIVEIAGAGNVDTVIVDGIVRKQHGKLTIAGATCCGGAPTELKESGARIMREGNYRVAGRAN